MQERTNRGDAVDASSILDASPVLKKPPRFPLSTARCLETRLGDKRRDCDWDLQRKLPNGVDFIDAAGCCRWFFQKRLAGVHWVCSLPALLSSPLSP
jgi:hypothetical protein